MNSGCEFQEVPILNLSSRVKDLKDYHNVTNPEPLLYYWFSVLSLDQKHKDFVDLI